MLSPATLSFLSELQEKSHSAYPEGCLLYTYVEASNQAHFRFPEGSSASPRLPSDELIGLARFLQASQGDYLSQSQSVGPSFILTARQLLEHLYADVAFDEVSCLIEEGGHDMEAKLKMARRPDNRFFELELWWSID